MRKFLFFILSLLFFWSIIGVTLSEELGMEKEKIFSLRESEIEGYFNEFLLGSEVSDLSEKLNGIHSLSLIHI